MVKIEGISVEELHKKLKIKRIEKLVKDVFGKNIDLSQCVNLYVGEKPRFLNYLKMSFSKPFLTINLFIDKNRFCLNDRKYFDKTYEFAKKYQDYFGEETTIKLEYPKK